MQKIGNAIIYFTITHKQNRFKYKYKFNKNKGSYIQIEVRMALGGREEKQSEE